MPPVYLLKQTLTKQQFLPANIVLLIPLLVLLQILINHPLANTLGFDESSNIYVLTIVSDSA